jgi:hypothetical protein
VIIDIFSMINNEILSFIKEQTASGSTKEQVKDLLVTQGGWDEKDVDEAFETIGFSGTSYPSVLKNAITDAVKSEHPEVKSGGAFAPASQLMQAVSGGAHPAVFSPGMSHMEQPKSMEPSVPAISEAMLRPKAITEAPVVSPTGAMAPAPGVFGVMGGGNSGLGTGMRPAPVFQPVIKEPAVASSFPKPSDIAPATMYQPPVTQPAAPSFAGSAVGGFAPSLAQQPASGGFSPFASLNKTPMSSPAPSPAVTSLPLQQMQQAPSTMGVFPKGPISSIGNPHGSPTPAQLAVLRTQKQKGGRFLLGFMMFLVGIAVGGIFMNAYMKGYINAEAASGVVEKVMDMIGLGTPVPSDGAASEAPAPEVPVDEGS